jgi:hypothetical protein
MTPHRQPSEPLLAGWIVGASRRTSMGTEREVTTADKDGTKTRDAARGPLFIAIFFFCKLASLPLPCLFILFFT